MKTRIIIQTDSINRILYYPQYKGWFLWHNFGETYAPYFHSKEDAEAFINKRLEIEVYKRYFNIHNKLYTK